MSGYAEDFRARMARTADDAAKPVPVTVRGLGDAFVRVLTAREWDLQLEAMVKVQSGDRLAFNAASAICDPEGNRIYDPANPDDIAFLGRQPQKVLEEICTHARTANGQGEQGAEEAKNA